jgi:beta-galactosidase
MGVRVEEFVPVPKGDKVALDNGWEGQAWSEVTHALDAEVVANFKDYPESGAVFRRTLGRGEVWYLATRVADLATGRNFLTGTAWSPALSLKPGGCAVIREA